LANHSLKCVFSISNAKTLLVWTQGTKLWLHEFLLCAILVLLIIILRRRLGDITNDDAETPPTSKHRRTRSPSPGSEDEGGSSRANDTFVYQSGHKFFLIYGPWVHLGDDLFETKFNKAYNNAERFENDENKAQGQLQEVWSLFLREVRTRGPSTEMGA